MTPREILAAWDTAALAFQGLLTTNGETIRMDDADPVYRIYDKAATAAHVGMLVAEPVGGNYGYRRPYSVAHGE